MIREDVSMPDGRYQNALAAIKVLGEQTVVDAPKADLEFVRKPNLWLAADRVRASNTLDAIAYGAVDLCGGFRFELPAEFYAATIVMHVHPMNYQVASNFVSGKNVKTVEGIVAGSDEVVTPARVFAMVLQIVSGDWSLVEGKLQEWQSKAKVQSVAVEAQ